MKLLFDESLSPKLVQKLFYRFSRICTRTLCGLRIRRWWQSMGIC